MPSFAFINDFERMKKLLKSDLEYEVLEKASRQLILYYVDEKLRNIPKDFICPQYVKMSIDPDCNVVTCCGDSTVFDKVYHLKPEQVNSWRLASEVCKECNRIGLSYILNNSVMPNHIITLK
ncbi:glycosyltransferase [Desulfocucumis palustris]|uniref:Glycosyltransferase n=2 Tax=Desulfocucumis palustris TaxID=1898651 RepID=A0A2L2XJS2_9FIRM|nr:glycosyltransferase [Desulfocucumis palustris]